MTSGKASTLECLSSTQIFLPSPQSIARKNGNIFYDLKCVKYDAHKIEFVSAVSAMNSKRLFPRNNRSLAVPLLDLKNLKFYKCLQTVCYRPQVLTSAVITEGQISLGAPFSVILCTELEVS